VSGDVDIAAAAAVLADQTRVRMLLSLDGDASRSAGELAKIAGVSASRASFHLSRLVASGLLVVSSDGRQRRFRLANPEIGELLERLAAISPEAKVASLRASVHADQVKIGRLCAQHLGGFIGVRLTMTFRARGFLEEDAEGYHFTDRGFEVVLPVAPAIEHVAQRSRRVARHPDWSEKSFHMAGAIAATLTAALLDNEWIQRVGPDRACKVTPRGHRELRAALGVEMHTPRIGNAAVLPS
jgi:DNA-binding transcriptional ArsR family regulator